MGERRGSGSQEEGGGVIDIMDDTRLVSLCPMAGWSHLQKAGSVDGDEVLVAPAKVLAHTHSSLLHAVLLHHRREDLRTLLERYQERSMPAHHHISAL